MSEKILSLIMRGYEIRFAPINMDMFEIILSCGDCICHLCLTKYSPHSSLEDSIERAIERLEYAIRNMLKSKEKENA